MRIRLFDQEELVQETQGSVFMSDSEINEKYIKGEIRIVTEQGRYPLETVAKMFGNKNKYNDLTDYQRSYVWSVERKSLLIESFIMNIPIPPIFLYEYDYSYYEILDGKQRISAIVDFYEGKYSLKGLEVWSELNGMHYSDLPSRVKEGLDRRYLSSMIMLKESGGTNSFSVAELKKIVFQRLNTGGLKLTTQEARNAIFGGPFNELCKNIASSTLFKTIWVGRHSLDNIAQEVYIDKRRMTDAETVLRFFAFRQLDKFDTNLNVFLDQYLNKANNFESELVEKLNNLYVDTLSFANDFFDGNPFRTIKINRDGSFSVSRKPEKFVYDFVMQVLSQYLDNKNVLLLNRGLIINRLFTAMKENRELFNGKYTHKAIIQKRIDLFNQIVISSINEA